MFDLGKECAMCACASSRLFCRSRTLDPRAQRTGTGFLREMHGLEVEYDCKDEDWMLSDTPAENFDDAEGADENGKWRMEVIGEEVAYNGEVIYEVHWSNWCRPDGTNTTKDNSLLTNQQTRGWSSKLKKKRERLAKESQDIEIWGTTDIHNRETRLRAQAFDEKLAKAEKVPSNLPTLLAQNMALLHAEQGKTSGYAGRLLRPISARKQTTRSLSRSSVSVSSLQGTSVRSVASELSSRGGPLSTPLTSMSPVPHKAAFTATSSLIPSKRALSPDVLESSRSKSSKLFEDTESVIYVSAKSKAPNRRLKIQNEWNKIIRRSNAARVEFVNEVDDEELPDLPPNFIYMETGYYDPDGLRPEYSDFITTCDCIECTYPSECGCQDASQAVQGEEKIFAYTNGLYSFKVDQNTEVIECNRGCTCDVDSCPNRVAQKPRDVPIEVFKTEDRGWGARSSNVIPKGKVLGIYAGHLITRERASRRTHNSAYCFDLDGFEYLGEAAPEGACTVDSRVRGNWTRFINHSCNPNLGIYFVVYDSVPESNTYYMAFVAREQIPARTEFTFDYSPQDRQIKLKKRQGEPIVPEGAKPCFCGSTSCRGFYAYHQHQH